jgi:transcription termination factor Rho
MSTPELDRSLLERKDRDELHAIAGAVGVKAPTRMRKADLITAILDAAGAAAPAAAAKPRTVRSARASAVAAASVEAIAAEENALAADAAEPEIAPRPRRSPASARAAEPEAAEVPAEPGPDPEPADDPGPAAAPVVRDDQDREVVAFEHDDDMGGGDGGARRRRRGRGRNRPFGEGEVRPGVDGSGEPVAVAGLLELRDEGYGFLRTTGFLAGATDVYVSASQVRRFSLRKGDRLEGASRPQASNEKYPALLRVDTVNGLSTDEARQRPRFDSLTPLFPDERLRLEQPDNPGEITGRMIDLLAPIGKGQRGLVVSPPKSGKTTVLKHIVAAIERNHPDVHVLVLLVDERPEEVTDMRRHMQRGEVIASTFDRPSEEHAQVAELAIERAKRLVEMGRDVVVVLDGITRLARAYNLAAPASGRVLSGGVDAAALYPPKRIFGAARNLEEGGSLTILATALVDTGSRMDEVIFEEFKGTGNMELRLDRRLAERRIYPAVDVRQSGTRHEELLFTRGQLNQIWKLRRVLDALEDGAGIELLVEKLRSTKSNEEFLTEMAKAADGGR